MAVLVDSNSKSVDNSFLYSTDTSYKQNLKEERVIARENLPQPITDLINRFNRVEKNSRELRGFSLLNKEYRIVKSKFGIIARDSKVLAEEYPHIYYPKLIWALSLMFQGTKESIATSTGIFESLIKDYGDSNDESLIIDLYGGYLSLLAAKPNYLQTALESVEYLLSKCDVKSLSVDNMQKILSFLAESKDFERMKKLYDKYNSESKNNKNLMASMFSYFLHFYETTGDYSPIVIYYISFAITRKLRSVSLDNIDTLHSSIGSHFYDGRVIKRLSDEQKNYLNKCKEVVSEFVSKIQINIAYVSNSANVSFIDESRSQQELVNKIFHSPYLKYVASSSVKNKIELKLRFKNDETIALFKHEDNRSKMTSFTSSVVELLRHTLKENVELHISLEDSILKMNFVKSYTNKKFFEFVKDVKKSKVLKAFSEQLEIPVEVEIEPYKFATDYMLEELLISHNDIDEKPNGSSINVAKQIIGFLHEKLDELLVSPSPDGGVMLELQENGHYFLIEIFNDGDIVYFKRSADGKRESYDVTTEEVIEKICTDLLEIV